MPEPRATIGLHSGHLSRHRLSRGHGPACLQRGPVTEAGASIDGLIRRPGFLFVNLEDFPLSSDITKISRPLSARIFMISGRRSPELYPDILYRSPGQASLTLDRWPDQASRILRHSPGQPFRILGPFPDLWPFFNLLRPLF